MNRPNVNDRTVWNDEKPYAINKKYVHELEKYCDHIENALNLLSDFLAYQHRERRACAYTCPFYYDKSCNLKCDEPKTWKEWSLNDE